MKICEKCGFSFPFNVFIDGKRKNLGSRKYCLNCSPWGSHNTRNLTISSHDQEVVCKDCGEKDKHKFHLRSDRDKPYPYCKKCHHKRSKKSKRNNKIDYINYKGGSCEMCGYDKCPGAMDFHHLNPDEKDFDIGCTKNPKLNDKIKNELDKCILVCSNCHREIHYKLSCEEDDFKG